MDSKSLTVTQEVVDYSLQVYYRTDFRYNHSLLERQSPSQLHIIIKADLELPMPLVCIFNGSTTIQNFISQL